VVLGIGIALAIVIGFVVLRTYSDVRAGHEVNAMSIALIVLSVVNLALLIGNLPQKSGSRTKWNR
jgi:hypothetical protein